MTVTTDFHFNKLPNLESRLEIRSSQKTDVDFLQDNCREPIECRAELAKYEWTICAPFLPLSARFYTAFNAFKWHTL